MIRRQVIVSPEAGLDLSELLTWIAERAGERTALSYVERVEAYCRGLDIGAERGNPRDDLRPGLRIVGFERSLTIAFSVGEQEVTILRVVRRGRNWTRAMTEPT